jgi:hypothetical protein
MNGQDVRDHAQEGPGATEPTATPLDGAAAAEDPALDETTPQTLVEDEEGGPPPPPSPRRPILPWLVAGIAVLLALAAGWFAYAERAGAAAEGEAATVASEALTAVMNWDADTLEDVRAQLEEIGTDRLQGEADEILDEVAEPLVEAGANSEGEVIDLVVEAARGEGVAMGIVRQTITSEALDAETQTCWGVRVMVTEEGGRWLADRMEPYGPGDCPAG